MSGIPPIAHYDMPASIDLPANIAQWSIDPDRTVLLIHDMQHYFVQPFDSQHKSHLIKNISLIRERSRSQGIPVAYSAQPGGMSSKQRGLLNDFWGPGMKVDPEERKIVEELSPTSDDWISTKWRYSAFFKSGLLERMREAGRDQLLLCGVYAHLGVLFTAVEAYTNDIQTFLVADAVADFSEEHHRLALEYAAKCCAVICPTEEVLT